jgi:hypothetical protein
MRKLLWILAAGQLLAQSTGATYDAWWYPFGAGSCSQYLSVPPTWSGNVSCTGRAKCYQPPARPPLPIYASAYAWVEGCYTPTTLTARGIVHPYSIFASSSGRGAVYGDYWESHTCDDVHLNGDPFFSACDGIVGWDPLA